MPEIIFNVCLFVLMAVVLWHVIGLRQLIYNVIYNDVYELMNQIMYDVFNRLSDSDKDKAFRSYLRDQRDDLYRRYMDAKRVGIALFKDDNFIQDVLGSTRTDLMKFGNFGDSFIKEIESANKKNMKRFLDMMLLDAGKTSYRKALKLNTLNAYKKTVNDIYRIYRQNDILKTHVILQTEDNSSFMRFINRVELNKKELFDSIAKGQISEVLDVLCSLPVEEHHRDMIIMLNSRYAMFAEKEKAGTNTDDVELKKITKATIDFIKEI